MRKIMLGRSVSAFTSGTPLRIQRGCLSMSRNDNRRIATAGAVTDKQVVVVGANRGIGLEVRRQSFFF